MKLGTEFGVGVQIVCTEKIFYHMPYEYICYQVDFDVGFHFGSDVTDSTIIKLRHEQVYILYLWPFCLFLLHACVSNCYVMLAWLKSWKRSSSNSFIMRLQTKFFVMK
jgi:hypothetical protein